MRVKMGASANIMEALVEVVLFRPIKKRDCARVIPMRERKARDLKFLALKVIFGFLKIKQNTRRIKPEIKKRKKLK